MTFNLSKTESDLFNGPLIVNTFSQLTTTTRILDGHLTLSPLRSILSRPRPRSRPHLTHFRLVTTKPTPTKVLSSQPCRAELSTLPQNFLPFVAAVAPRKQHKDTREKSIKSSHGLPHPPTSWDRRVGLRRPTVETTPHRTGIHKLSG